MKPMRSPTHNTTRAGGSQPDLSKLNNEPVDPQITLRKRKQPFDRECQCSEDMKTIRNELSRITSLLENYADSNAQLMSKMNESIAEVKKDITDLKMDIKHFNNTTTQILQVQSKINDQIKELQAKVTHGENKIKTIADTVNKIDPKTSETRVNRLQANENIMREIQERKKRECNIIMVGVAEPAGDNIKERYINEESEVIKIITSLKNDISKPEKFFRLGKYNPEKPRKLKVCFANPEQTTYLLRNKDKLPANVKFFSDQTPTQYKYLTYVKDELKRRTANGETNLTIKYIQGTPTIINKESKN